MSETQSYSQANEEEKNEPFSFINLCLFYSFLWLWSDICCWNRSSAANWLWLHYQISWQGFKWKVIDCSSSTHRKFLSFWPWCSESQPHSQVGLNLFAGDKSCWICSPNTCLIMWSLIKSTGLVLGVQVDVSVTTYCLFSYYTQK